MMAFKAATARLMDRVTISQIADECGVSRNTVERARMDGDHARPAPPGWEKAVAKLARERAGELAELAEELEQ